MMRPAAFAGQFYPATERELQQAIEECFNGERGPGSLPHKKQDREVIAFIAPHAGYQFSGPCAAWCYHALGASPKPDLFIILGPNHNDKTSGTSLETWQTPLGTVRPDQAFVKALIEKGNLKVDEESMLAEHSIEVQLPFLQYILKDEPEKLKICPILVSEDADLQQLSIDLKETLLEQNKQAVFIVSSDFTHHGPQYHYVKFSQEKAKNIYEFDGQMIEFVKQQNLDGFLAFVEENFATVCGTMPIALLLTYLKPASVKLEQYYTSGDVLDDYRNSVSYAAIVFEKK